ncbi:tRNA (guanine(9)-N(1))-methyltransferase [Podochytrium sp. JEL0797]|nr:tRNA (guanine(9)-N(1))-methyltransferase [Podochytrium sp. JEL0797]
MFVCNTDIEMEHPPTTSTPVEETQALQETAPTPIDPPAAVAATTTDPTTSSHPPLSKNALKRQRKEEQRLLQNEQRKKQRKEKKAEQKAYRLEHPVEHTTPKPPKLDPLRPTSAVRIVVDCDFEADQEGKPLMNPKEVTSMARQLMRCYSENRRAAIPVTLSACGMGSGLSTALDTLQRDWKNWKFETSETKLMEGAVADTDNIVYLTADSETVLEELDETKAYIIGGIVDRNRYKNLCFDRAEAAGLKTAQLPIGEYIKMASRKVLTVNQVLEIMVKFLETKEWKEAFLHVIPQRKIKPKTKNTKNGGEAEGEGSDANEEDGEGPEDEKDDAEKDGAENGNELEDKEATPEPKE